MILADTLLSVDTRTIPSTTCASFTRSLSPVSMTAASATPKLTPWNFFVATCSDDSFSIFLFCGRFNVRAGNAEFGSLFEDLLPLSGDRLDCFFITSPRITAAVLPSADDFVFRFG